MPMSSTAEIASHFIRLTSTLDDDDAGVVKAAIEQPVRAARLPEEVSLHAARSEQKRQYGRQISGAESQIAGQHHRERQPVEIMSCCQRDHDAGKSEQGNTPQQKAAEIGFLIPDEELPEYGVFGVGYPEGEMKF